MDWDGYTGVIPRTSATLAKVLGEYGYKTAAFGKWHNTPATRPRPWGHSPMADRRGSASTTSTAFSPARPRNGSRGSYENLNPIEPPHDPKYHLSEDIADKAIDLAEAPSRFLARQAVLHVLGARRRRMGRTTSSRNGPTNTKGKFDDGWDELRERVFKRQKELGWIPADTKLTPRAETMAGVGQHPGGASAPSSGG